MAYFSASVDTPETNKAFAQSLGVDYPLLSDPSKAVATAYGVVLVVVSLVVRFLAFLPEMVVVSLRRLATFVMSAIDLPLLGVAYPLLKWWAGSKLGKALGFPALEEPIDWPPVGYVELDGFGDLGHDAALLIGNHERPLGRGRSCRAARRADPDDDWIRRIL